MRYCKYCGEVIPDEVGFCRNCEKDKKTELNHAWEQVANKFEFEDKKLFRIICGYTALVVCLSAIYRLIEHYSVMQYGGFAARYGCAPHSFPRALLLVLSIIIGLVWMIQSKQNVPSSGSEEKSKLHKREIVVLVLAVILTIAWFIFLPQKVSAVPVEVAGFAWRFGTYYGLSIPFFMILNVSGYVMITNDNIKQPIFWQIICFILRLALMLVLKNSTGAMGIVMATLLAPIIPAVVCAVYVFRLGATDKKLKINDIEGE